MTLDDELEYEHAEPGRVARVWAWLKHRPATVAWVLLIVVVVAGFWRVEGLVADVDADRARDAYEDCVLRNEARAGIVDVVKALTGPTPSERGQAAIALAEATVPELDCATP